MSQSNSFQERAYVIRLLLGAVHRMSSTQVTQYVERELMTHRLLWHPHVIKLYKVFLTSTHLAVVLEYAGVLHDEARPLPHASLVHRLRRYV